MSALLSVATSPHMPLFPPSLSSMCYCEDCLLTNFVYFSYSSTRTGHIFSVNSGYGQNGTYGSAYNASYGAQQSPSRSGSSSIGRYDPYAPPRIPQQPPAAAVPAGPGASRATTLTALLMTVVALTAIRFKPSPFHRIEQAVSHVVECQGAVPLL